MTRPGGVREGGARHVGVGSHVGVDESEAVSRPSEPEDAAVRQDGGLEHPLVVDVGLSLPAFEQILH